MIRNLGRTKIAGVTFFEDWVNPCLDRRVQDMSVARCASSKADMPFVRCYEEVEYKRALSGLNQQYYKHDARKLLFP